MQRKAASALRGEYHPITPAGAERSSEAGTDQNICHTLNVRRQGCVLSCVFTYKNTSHAQMRELLSKSTTSRGRACNYKPTCSQVINYSKSAFSIQICSLIPDGAHLSEPAVKWFKQSPSGGSRPGSDSPVAGEGRVRRAQLPQPAPILPEPFKGGRLSLQSPTGGAEEEFWLSRGR